MPAIGSDELNLLAPVCKVKSALYIYTHQQDSS